MSLSFLAIGMTEEYDQEFRLTEKQWRFMRDTFNPRRRGKDLRLDAEIRRRLAFSAPWDGIFSTEYRWLNVEKFQTPSFRRVADTVRNWIAKETPETEEAMEGLVWDSTGIGGPELFQQELCCIIQYSQPWIKSMFTATVINRLKKSAAVKEWQEFYERGEIPNRVIYR